MFTPAMVFEIGRSRTVTCRAHPPSDMRLWAWVNEYLNESTSPASLRGGIHESGFLALRRAAAGSSLFIQIAIQTCTTKLGYPNAAIKPVHGFCPRGPSS